jgi:SNF2 family DNA or RNA helicase
MPSVTLSRAAGWLGGTATDLPDEPAENGEAVPVVAAAASDIVAAEPVTIRKLTVPSVTLTPLQAADLLPTITDVLEDRASMSDGTSNSATWLPASSLKYFAEVVRLARHLLCQQRFVPALTQTATGELTGIWTAWLSDEASAQRAAMLVGAMPPSARAVDDGYSQNPWLVTQSMLDHVVDALCRRTLSRESFVDSVSDRSKNDPHVAWLSGLLADHTDIDGPPAVKQDLPRRLRTWISVLEERGPSSQWRLLLRLAEPDMVGKPGDAIPGKDEAAWTVSFHLQSVESPALIIDAEDVWLITGESVTIQGKRLDQPHDLLLAELGRASRFFPRIEDALSDSEPTKVELTTQQAYQFLRENRPILFEQGFAIEAPDWWDSPAARVGAKLHLESEGLDPFSIDAGGMTNAARAQLGLNALVNYRWEISVGDTTLSMNEFEQLAAKRTPLVRINGRWIEIRPEDVHAAIKFIRENPGGRIKLGEAMRMAYAADIKTTGVPIVGLEATGWLQAFLNSESSSRQIRMLETPKSFLGTLRPYQARGVSWLAFQEALGFGVCLADDMGLGKTIQLLALMAWEREGASELLSKGINPNAAILHPTSTTTIDSAGTPLAPALPTPLPLEPADNTPPDAALAPDAISTIPPTLLLVPMSVVGNWIHETKRFCPHLRVLVHHGSTRSQGDTFLGKAACSDLVITTYSLANRDRELLAKMKWGRIVLDEAQYIKNPAAKQSQAVHTFDSDRRVALTGTPVENRLTELWSIMDFLNPGYLGSAGSFRQNFAVPVERYKDRSKAEQLRGLIRPFVLRRLKTDPNVVQDLPEKVESKEFSHLTAEQASLYENCVKRMLTEVDAADGMQRRGLVLAALVKLKQICNHPSLVLHDTGEGTGRTADPSRSGKCIRVLEMLDEVIAEGDQALVFTQFRTMGTMLEAMLRQRFGKDVLFIHGGTTQPQRQAMIDRFQKADGTAPILLLSLRAGGVGLNLTAATHVFHFDRWWNPAVENQATDRAYRIGQTRTVQVHKFVVRGTLEERIDQMIESKIELAQNIIGNGEAWLTDLNTDQLRDILTLRNDAVDDLD